MAGFEFFNEETQMLEKELARLGYALGIDWSNDAQVRALAREALSGGHKQMDESAKQATNYSLRAKTELFGLAALMLRVMEKSADGGAMSHGGPAWKAFGRALWEEKTSP